MRPWAIALISAAVALSGYVAADAQTTCTVTLSPGEQGGLANAVKNYGPGTTFCLTSGTFKPPAKVPMDSNDQLIGAGRTATHVDLSKVPVAGTSGCAICWPGRTTAGTAVVKALDIYNAPVNLNYSPRGCLAAIGGQEHTRVIDSHLHGNAWGFGISSPDWYVANNELDNNGKGDGSGGGHCQGYSNGDIKVIGHGDFYGNFIHDNAVAGIWYDAAPAKESGEISGNTFARNMYYDVAYEVGSGGLSAHDNVHNGGTGNAYDIVNSCCAHIYSNKIPGAMGADEIHIWYNFRSLPDDECQAYGNPDQSGVGGCTGTPSHDVVVDHNQKLDGVKTGWMTHDGVQHSALWGPNGCKVYWPDGSLIKTSTCYSNTAP